MVNRVVCKECRFSEGEEDDDGDERLYCHRYAPRLHRLQFDWEGMSSTSGLHAEGRLHELVLKVGGAGPWPEVYDEGWCGEAERK